MEWELVVDAVKEARSLRVIAAARVMGRELDLLEIGSLHPHVAPFAEAMLATDDAEALGIDAQRAELWARQVCAIWAEHHGITIEAVEQLAAGSSD